jgi:hypothetical protein
MHLNGDGSFRRALSRRGDPETDYLSDLMFVAFRCCEIEAEFEPIYHRAACQAVEHEAHCVLAERVTQYTVISDTLRTAPRRFARRQRARSLAQDCVARFIEAIGG